jgi:hypothetical protein
MVEIEILYVTCVREDESTPADKSNDKATGQSGDNKPTIN